MRIEQLILTAFGRFHGRTLTLGPGLNLLYGPNEAGKSTVQRFISGMLYGFKKRGQRREFTEEALRFRPWLGAEYRGALLYALDRTGQRFRVEREFEPARDQVRLYDGDTGAEVTARFPMDKRKEVLFAEAHLGLTEEAFRSTAWIGQLEMGRLEAGRELIARVANLRESGREDLSVRAALERLEEQSRAIGGEKAAAKPYGRVLRLLTERREELGRAERSRREAMVREARLAGVRRELGEAERWLSWARALEAEEQLRRLRAGSRRVRELRAEAEAVSRYARLPAGADPERLARLQAEAEEAAERAERYRARAAELRGQRGHRSESVGGGVRWGVTAAMLLAAAGVAAGLGWLWPAGGLGLLAAAAGALWYRHRQAAAAQARASAVLRYELAEAEEREAAEAARADRAQAQVEALLAAAGVASAEEYAEACDRHRAWRRLTAEADALAAATGAGAAEEAALAAEAERLRAEAGGEPPLPAAPLAARELEGRRAALMAEAADLSARLEAAAGGEGAGVGDPAEIARELAALQEEKESYEEELAALALARDVLTEASAELHREFAPRLNEAVGEIVAGLTEGRYSTVRIDEQGVIRALAEGDRTAPLEALSGGTIDQFYLALRLALLDLVTEGGEPVPVILDDPFVQFDDDRARAAMEYLAAVSLERQVILLTCHQREARLARALAPDGRVINLREAAVE